MKVNVARVWGRKLVITAGSAVLLAGCSSQVPEKKADKPADAVTDDSSADPADKTAVETPVKPAKPDPRIAWDKLISQADKQIEAGEIAAADETLVELAKVYAEPDKASEEQLADLAKLNKELAGLKASQAEAKRNEQLKAAKQLLAEGKLEDSRKTLQELLTLSPTDEQDKEANELLRVIEKRREASQRLKSFVTMLESETPAEVRSARDRLSEDPNAAMSLLVERVATSNKPVFVANALYLMRKLELPEAALPAMVGVLSRTAQKENWKDAIKEISAMAQPGAGAPLMKLVLSSKDAAQRQAALDALAKIVDPPTDTEVALLPLIYADGPELPQALLALHHAVTLHGQFDFAARRGLETELSPQQEEQLAGLPDRLAKLIEAGTGSEGAAAEAAQAAKVLSVTTRQMSPQPLKVVEIKSVGAEMPDSPGSAAIDGVWDSVDAASMWRYPIGDRNSIVLDLGETRTVTGVRIWNFNEPNATYRGWKECEIFVSDDPRTLDPVAAGIVPAGPGVAGTPDYSTIVPVDCVRGRYVKLQAKSLWKPETHTGLSEVQVIGF